jgi:translation initiation factor 3 subunit F
VKVNATVIFSILNNFTRRVPRDSRVVGTLLGEVRDGVVVVGLRNFLPVGRTITLNFLRFQVTDCFAVPFTEKTDEHVVAVDQKYHKTMYSFHRRNNKKEVVVGWYTTTTSQGQFINDNSALINDVYLTECVRPVHLVMDTTLLGSNMDIRGFVNSTVSVGEDALASCFQEIKVEVGATDGEATCLYSMLSNQEGEKWGDSSIVSTLPSSADNVEHAIVQLQQVLDSVQAYVDAVVEGNTKAPVSREIGITLADTLNSFAVQKASAQQSGASQTRLQDMVMVSYISTLAQTQALISEKLNEILV